MNLSGDQGPVRILIADDEPVARDLLRSLVESRSDTTVVGECEDGLETVEAIREKRPELVLLDIQMPGLDGFQVLQKLDRGDRPGVVFVTAYDDYAVRAFEYHAMDYLLKPVDPDRFEDAMTRSLRALRGAALVEQWKRLDRMLAGEPSQRDDGDWVVVRRADERVPLRWQDVDWLESAGNYVRVNAAGEAYLLRATLSDLEKELRPKDFARVHRSTLVQVRRIARLLPSGHGDFDIIMRDGSRLAMSRRYRSRLEEVVGRLGLSTISRSPRRDGDA